MMQWLEEDLGINLSPERLDLGESTWVQIDGVSHDPPVLVEAWAHQGKAKSAQRNKGAADALKLSIAKSALSGGSRLILLFADHDAASEFKGSSWRATAIADLGVEVVVANIPDSVKSEIHEAQSIQYR